MHEIALARRIIEIISERAETDRFDAVKRIRIDIGPFTCVEPRALETAFDVAARKTCAEGARLMFTTVPAEAHCRHCGSVRQVVTYDAVCEDCATRLDIVGGADLRISDLEVV